MPDAGELRERIRFEPRGLDEFDEPTGAFDAGAGFTMAAKVLFIRGTSEQVMAQRLQGTQPVVITVRDCSNVRRLDGAWRAVDTRTGQTFDIAGTEPTRKGLVVAERGFRDILAMSGKPDGGERTET